MKLDIRADIKEAQRGLSRIQKRVIPKATSEAINDLLFPIAKKEAPKEMDRVFEGGPTKFTRNAFLFSKSNAKNLTAYVFAKDIQGGYLKFAVAGGTRFPKNRTILASTKNSELNEFGNIKRGTLKKMLTDRKKYFKGVPKGQPMLGEGIFERYGRRRWSKKQKKLIGGKIRKVASYIDRGQYRPIFPFAEIAGNVVFSRDDGIARKFRRRLREELEKRG